MQKKYNDAFINFEKNVKNFTTKPDLQKSFVLAVFAVLFFLDTLYRLILGRTGGIITISQEFLLAILCAFFSRIFKQRQAMDDEKIKKAKLKKEGDKIIESGNKIARNLRDNLITDLRNDYDEKSKQFNY